MPRYKIQSPLTWRQHVSPKRRNKYFILTRPPSNTISVRLNCDVTQQFKLSPSPHKCRHAVHVSRSRNISPTASLLWPVVTSWLHVLDTCLVTSSIFCSVGKRGVSLLSCPKTRQRSRYVRDDAHFVHS